MATQEMEIDGDGDTNSEELTPQAERKAVKKLGYINLKAGEIWYAVSYKWYEEWKKYTAFDAKDDEIDGGLENLHLSDTPRPGPIDNSDLQDAEDELQLRKDLAANETHVWVHSSEWELLHGWYGGGPVFQRTVVSRGTDKRIEMYPQFLQIIECTEEKNGEADEETTKYMQFPLDYSIQQVHDKIAESMEEEKTSPKLRLWSDFGTLKKFFVSPTSAKHKVVEDDFAAVDDARIVEIPDDQFSMKLEDIHFNNGQLLYVEKPLKKGKKLYPRDKSNDDWMNFEIADTIDCLDAQKKWYQAMIRQVQGEGDELKILVHYLGWDSKWDEWIAFKDFKTKLNKRGTKTAAPYRKQVQKSNYNSRNYSSSKGSSGSRNGWSYYSNDEGTPMQEGVVGLRNLGNTCFMNSTIQCLAQSPWLTDYFIDGVYKNEINRDNPLGWKGVVADAWADLVTRIFSNKYKTVAPREFKGAIGKVAPRFTGYAQQDSQELLSFLLDGLHEDLNRIKDKPATESVDSNGRPDDVVAAEAWRTYLLRNQSIVVDILQGQYKSRVVCPDCDRVSITFDPYMFLSVPLPTEKYKQIELTYFDATDTTRPPTVYGFKVQKISDMSMLKGVIRNKLELTMEENDELVIADVWKSKAHRQFKNHDMIQDIRHRTDDIWVVKTTKRFAEANYFESLPAPEETTTTSSSTRSSYYKPKPLPPWKTFFVTNVIRTKSRFQPSTGPTRYEDQPFGVPLPLTLPTKGEVSGAQIIGQLRGMLEPFIRNPADELPYSFRLQITYTQSKVLEDTDELIDLTPVNLRFIVAWRSKDDYITELYEPGTRARDESAPRATKESDKRTNYSRAQENRGQPVALGACIEAFTEQETLSENDAWYCSGCQNFKCATKKIDLWSSPDLLIIHLKRFSYTRLWRDRINTLVEFPIEGFDLGNYILDPNHKGDSVYDLYAVSNHMGGLGGGHYTAYGKNLRNGQWYHLDDSRTTLVGDPQRVVSSSAYVLYYRKRNPHGITHRASQIQLPGIDQLQDNDDTPNDDVEMS